MNMTKEDEKGVLTSAGRQEFYEILCHLLRWAEDENALAHQKLQKLFGVADAPTSAYRSTALHGREELKRWLVEATSGRDAAKERDEYVRVHTELCDTVGARNREIHRLNGLLNRVLDGLRKAAEMSLPPDHYVAGEYARAQLLGVGGVLDDLILKIKQPLPPEAEGMLSVDDLADKLAEKMLPALKAGWDAFAPPRSSTPTDFFDHTQRTAERPWASLRAGTFHEGVIIAIEWKNDRPKGNAERIGPREINGTLYDIYVDSDGKAWAKRCVSAQKGE